MEKIIFVLFFIVLPSITLAESDSKNEEPIPIYVGLLAMAGSVGVISDSDSGVTNPQQSDSLNSLGFVIGLQLASFLKAEFFYLDHGSISINGTTFFFQQGQTESEMIRVEQEINSFGLNLLLNKKIRNRLDIYGTMGVYDASIERQGLNTQLVTKDSGSTTGFTFGFGAEMAIGKNYSARVGYNKFLDMASNFRSMQDHSYDIDGLSAAILFSF